MRSAWDNETDEVVVIRRGQADELRPGCHAGRLVCPIPGCTEPAFTTRRGFVNRWGTDVTDGFRHRVAPLDAVHTPESVRHQEGKAQVAAWLRELGLSTVRLERSVKVGHRPGTSREGIRRPDVQAVTQNGRKVAFEIQVSRLGAQLWQERTSELSRAGFTVVWLWTWPVRDPVNADTTAMRSQIASGTRPWFFDPQSDEGPLLAATHQAAKVDDRWFQIPPLDPTAPLLLTWRPLAEHHLDGDCVRVGIGETDDSAAHAEATKRRESRRNALAAASNRSGATSTPTSLAALAKADAQGAERRRRAARRGSVPLQGPLPPEIHALSNGVSPFDHQIWTAPVKWKSALAWHLLARDQGVRVAIADVIGWVELNFPCDSKKAIEPVRAFLRSLEAVGAVECSINHVVVKAFTVLEDRAPTDSTDSTDSTVRIPLP